MQTLQEVFEARRVDTYAAMLVTNLAVVSRVLEERYSQYPHLAHDRLEPEDVPLGATPKTAGGAVFINRHVERLAGHHGLSRHQLLEFAIGGLVVDVGAGQSNFLDTFSYDTQTLAVDIHPPHLEYQRLRNHKTLLASGGDLGEIESDSVRLLHASFSLPFWARSVREARNAADEYVRVLEPGGVALAGPLAESDEHADQQTMVSYHNHGLAIAGHWLYDGRPNIPVIRSAFYKRLFERDDIDITGYRYQAMTLDDMISESADAHVANFLMIQKRTT